jgi:oxygen-dependent protoporphyrinogen oxidase
MSGRASAAANLPTDDASSLPAKNFGSEKSAPHIAIVGAGLTGLTAAWKLQRMGFAVTVFEKSQLIGGRTLSIRKDGFVFDTGAITLLPTYTNICALVEELGIQQHLHRVNPIIGIPRGGKMHHLDISRPFRSLIGIQLISLGTKLRLLKLLGPMMRTWKKSNYQSLAALAEWDQETVADFVRREFGEEANEYIAGPVIRGNTLNSTACAPAGELLWMLRQYAAPFIYAFDQGINFLAETLAQRVPVELGAEIIDIKPIGNQVEIKGRCAQGEFSRTFDACILGLPPPQLSVLAPNLSVRQQQFLKQCKSLVSVNLHVGLRRRPDITETIILPPESEQPVLTTIVMDHLKAPGRAPEGKGLVTFYLRDSWCAENFAAPDAQILASVMEMAKPFIGDLSADVESFVVQRWPYAIIKSSVGLYRQIADYEADLDLNSRVQIGGDFLSMGMEAAVSSGAAMAERIGRIVSVATAKP